MERIHTVLQWRTLPILVGLQRWLIAVGLITGLSQHGRDEIFFMPKNLNRKIIPIIFPAVLIFMATAATAGNISVDTATIGTISGQPLSNGVIFSTSVYFVSGASLTMQGSGGYITALSSVNAASFFGDGGHLNGIGALASTQTFSGASTFTSSFTIRSNGREIILSTSATNTNIDISPSGAITFFPDLHNSSATIIPDATTTDQYCGPCVSGSTLTITTTGGSVEISFSGSIGNNDDISAINFLQDGQFVGDLGTDAVIAKTVWSMIRLPPVAVHYLVKPLPPGIHSYCLSLCTNSSRSLETAELLNNSTQANIFFIKELK